MGAAKMISRGENPLVEAKKAFFYKAFFLRVAYPLPPFAMAPAMLKIYYKA